MRIHASSGTTVNRLLSAIRKTISTLGPISSPVRCAQPAVPDDKIHVAYGYGLFTGGLGAHYGAERLGATVIPMSGGQTEKQAQLILAISNLTRDHGDAILLPEPD